MAAQMDDLAKRRETKEVVPPPAEQDAEYRDLLDRLNADNISTMMQQKGLTDPSEIAYLKQLDDDSRRREEELRFTESNAFSALREQSDAEQDRVAHERLRAGFGSAPTRPAVPSTQQRLVVRVKPVGAKRPPPPGPGPPQENKRPRVADPPPAALTALGGYGSDSD